MRAEEAGFDAVMCSDHLAPWSNAQGHSGFTWTWLGAALQATDHVPMGSFHAPGQRYHPVISAQAMATVAAMFPGRFPWVALGSGEALNEHVTGDGWPVKAERMARLRECVDVMRALWAGEEVTHRGHVVVDRARLWSLPDEPPRLVAGAISEATAAGRPSGPTASSPSTSRETGCAASSTPTATAGGRGHLQLQVHLAHGEDDDAALDVAYEQWRSNCLPTCSPGTSSSPSSSRPRPATCRPTAVAENVRVSADLGQHAAWLREDLDLGFDELFLHHVGQEQEAFIDAFGAKVLPQLRA